MIDALYKVATIEQWEKSLQQDEMILSTMDTDFIHFSTREQVIKTLEKFYPNQEMIIAKVDPKKLIGDLRFETNPGGDIKYYHLYNGKIPMDSIIATYKIQMG